MLLRLAMLAAALASTPFLPVRLHKGVNQISNIAGDGKTGTITLDWRDNGNAWGYDIYTVAVGGSVATVDGRDRFTDSPHTGEDVITSVRFARRVLNGRSTLHALVSTREIVSSVPAPAATSIKIYALVRNDEGTGTPYEFKLVRQFRAKLQYCNADMALQTELGFPVARTYSGVRSANGC